METLHFSDGAGGEVLRPVGRGPYPAIVVAPAVAGVTHDTRRTCARLAARGYLAMAMDYYRGGGSPPMQTPQDVHSAAEALDDRRVLTDLRTIHAGLTRRDEVEADHIGVLGFCIGGSYALRAASAIPALACTVAFYGTLRYPHLSATRPVSPLDTVPKITVPLLFHVGTTDHVVPRDDVDDLEAAAASAVAPVEVYRYPGAGHAFHDASRPGYRPAAAQLAWLRTTMHLDWHLLGKEVVGP